MLGGGGDPFRAMGCGVGQKSKGDREERPDLRPPAGDPEARQTGRPQ